jgi:hypothetical protein
VFLASLTTACATSPEPLKVTEYVNVYLPDSQLVDCPKTEYVPGVTYRGLGKLVAARGTDLDNCNDRWKSLREYQAELKAKEAAAKAKKP